MESVLIFLGVLALTIAAYLDGTLTIVNFFILGFLDGLYAFEVRHLHNDPAGIAAQVLFLCLIIIATCLFCL